LARTLIHEPKILFLDEPTAGLDPEAAREVRDLIKKFSTEGRTIFLSTHNLGEADLLCHRIAVIKTKLLIVDTPNNLRKKIFQSRVIITLEAITQPVIKVIKALVYIDNFEQLNNKLIINFKDPEKNRPELLESIIKAGGRVLEVTQEQHSLEDVYLTLIKEDKHEL
jgi:ABC-2 type transport system ATP-binding protein